MAASLTARQVKYCRLVADGMSEPNAVLEAGYSTKGKYNTLNTLRNNHRVQAQINYYLKSEQDNEIATKQDREKLWTSIMNDPAFTGGIRLEASKLLGKAQGDFITSSKVEHNIADKPVVLIPESSPKEWEEYWEKTNDEE